MNNTTELAIYKQNKINELKRIFIENCNRLYAAVTYNIKAVNATRAKNKQSVISMFITKYNNDVLQLRNKLTADINKINSYNPVFNVTTVKNKKALLIGINYTNTPYQLTGCVEDASRMKETLSSFGFDQFEVLTDTGEVKPTKDIILKKFKTLITTSTAGDMVLFYFSGHGSSTYDAGSDEEDGKDEMIISSDLQGVLDDEFKQILSAYMKPGVTLIGFFDSCHSGTMFDLKFNYTDGNNYSTSTDNDRVSECNGNVIMISGCMDAQTSEEAYINGKIEGAMTWSFIESVKGSGDTKLSWRELVQSMRTLLKTNGFDQLPQLSTDTFYDLGSKVVI